MLPLFLLLIFSSAAIAQSQQDTRTLPPFIDSTATYIWPTNASDYFSATFGETRSAHFHAATDIGTWGREGYDVYAARDGVLFRVGISPHGYGNVVYLQHDDGSFSVYAHLQDFEDGIRKIVDAQRFQTWQHSYDEILVDHNIRFKQGEIIGRSGSTGIGPPHLHFELRSPNNAAFNPMLAGVHIADSVPPTFASLAILPISSNALVNGSSETRISTPTRSGNHFNFGQVEAEGTIGLAVNASDRSDNGRNVYAVYELTMEVNGQPLFHSKADSFPMGQSRQMLIDRVYPLLQQRRGAFQRLHILPANTLPFYNRELGDGLLHLEAGRHEVLVTALDFYGNKATASLEINVPESSRYAPAGQEFFFKAGIGTSPSPLLSRENHPGEYVEWSHKWLRPVGAELNEVSIRSIGDFGRPVYRYETLKRLQTAPLSGPAVQVHSAETGGFTLHRVLPDQKTDLRFPAHRMHMSFPAGVVFDTTYIHASRHTAKRSDYIRISPGDVPLQRSYELTITLPDSLAGDSSVGLYFVNERSGGERYMHSSVEGKQLSVRMEGFGLYVVRQDLSGPQISRPQLWRRNSDQRWFVSVRATDRGSGIDFNQAVFKVNGERGIAEYDPFGHQLRYYLPGFTPVRGDNEVTITVPDRSGNVTEMSFTLSH